MKTPDIKQLSARFKTHNARAVAHEFHTVASLARRILVSRPTAYAMIERGDLVPLDRDQQGRLVFLAAKLDETRREVVDNTTAEVLRQLAPMNLSEREEAMHCVNALHELARRSKLDGKTSHELGVGSALFKIAAGLGSRGGVLRGASKWALRNPALAIPAAGAALGGVGGAVKAVTDGGPETGIVGGVLKGAAGGALTGGAAVGGGALIAKSPLGTKLAASATRKIEAAGPKIIGGLKSARADVGTGLRQVGKFASDATPAIAGGAAVGAGIGGIQAATDDDPRTGIIAGMRKSGRIGLAGGLGLAGIMGARKLSPAFSQFAAKIRGQRCMSFEQKVEELRKLHPMTTGKAARMVRRMDPESYAALEESRKIYVPKCKP